MVTPNIINEVKERLIKTYKPISIYVFGSYAWGKLSEESDLDLLVVIDHSDEKTYERPVAGHHALADINIPKDIIVYTQKEFDLLTSKPMSLCSKIKKEGEQIYARA